MEQCNNSQIDSIIKWMGPDYYKCLYPYLDMLEFGCDSPQTKTWVLIDYLNNITCVLFQYHQTLHLFSHNPLSDADITQISDFVLEHKPVVICGMKQILEQVYPLLNCYDITYGTVGQVNDAIIDIHMHVQSAIIEDYKEIAKILNEDPLMNGGLTLEEYEDGLIERFKSGFARNYYIKQNDVIIAHCCTTAESNTMAVLGGGITHPDFRGQGLSIQVLGKLIADLLSENKEVYSYYYGEAPSKMHWKLGFTDLYQCAKLSRK